MEIKRIENKCNKCMLCVRDCVSGVWRKINGIPVAAAPELCNRCSHCLAVCPRGAIIHTALDAGQVKQVDAKKINPAYYFETVASRRSVRNFRDKDVPESLIQQILELARYSPTASNEQNVGYIVITKRELLEKVSKKIFRLSYRLYGYTQKGIGKLVVKATGNSENRYLKIMEYTKEQTDAGRDFILHKAPVLILVHAPRKNFAGDNCCIAAANIVNYSHSLGLGTCFIGLLTLFLRYSKKTRMLFQIPKGSKVYVSIALGYPAYKHKFTASRKKPAIKWI